MCIRDSIGTAYVARFDFNTEKDEEILVNTAISGVSMEGAAKNLQAEVPVNDFDRYHTEAVARWNKELSKIEVNGNNTDDLVKFYTAMYHTMIAPTIFSDVDGSYYGPDNQIHKACLLYTSSIIANYLDRLVQQPKVSEEPIPDIVLSLLGAGKIDDDDDLNGRKAYHKYLEEKYQF